jgi:hypothetical protein
MSEVLFILPLIKGSGMHLHSITGTCSTKDYGVERHNQSVSNLLLTHGELLYLKNFQS